MKRIVALLLVIVLTLASVASADSFVDKTKIKAKNTSKVKATASEWYASSETRAMATILVSLDVFNQMSDYDSNEISDFWVNPSYVGITNNNRQILVVGYYGSTTILTMIYTPSKGEIEYFDMKMSSGTPIDASTVDMMMKTVILNSNNNVRDYYQNDPGDMYSCMSKLAN